MTTPTDWLLAAGLMVLLYFTVLLADNILQKGMGAGRKFWRKHIVADFPHPDECFDCKKWSCVNCEILSGPGRI